MHIHVWVCPLKGTRFQLQDNYVLFGWAVSAFLFLPFFSGVPLVMWGLSSLTRDGSLCSGSVDSPTTGLFRKS